ncbi:hypothetical protein BIU98_02340 [Curtobacterium sp. MMLR14_010]|nr:hypothetical protein BIU98_02340 [Curtobacterium sp. MMLR14_010]
MISCVGGRIARRGRDRATGSAGSKCAPDLVVPAAGAYARAQRRRNRAVPEHLLNDERERDLLCAEHSPH